MGTMDYESGARYEGEWHADMRHGNGKYIFANGNCYEGGWRNGTWHGMGTSKNVNGSSYVGEYKFGKRHGTGTMQYANRNSYQGRWKHDTMHGKGKWVLNGNVFEGEFKDGKKDGSSTIQFPNGEAHDQVYTNGELLSSTRHAATFFTKLMEMEITASHSSVYECLLELPALVEDVHMMKLLYTAVAACYRMSALTEEEAMDVTRQGLAKTSEACTHLDAIVIFKLILEKAYEDGLIARADFHRFDNLVSCEPKYFYFFMIGHGCIKRLNLLTSF